MRRFYLLPAIAALSFAAPASAQYVSVIQECSKDLARFCAADRLEGGKLAQCTKAHFLDLNDACRSALVKIATVGEACRADVQQQCPSTKPGAGRILLCVKKHFSALSEPCKDAVGRAADSRQHAGQD